MRSKKLKYKPNIVIPPVIEEKMEKYRQIKHGTESGGVLLGKILEDNTIIVCDCSKPCISGKASYAGFYRSADKANKIIEQAFIDSGGRLIYVGEWHTHPEDSPTPSNVDKHSLEDIYNSVKNFYPDVLVYIIIGKKSNYYGYYDGVLHHNIFE